MTAGRTLLAEFAANGSEEAFRELTHRYVNLVFATAFRLMGRDAHGAEDVVQTVFVDLARLAGTLSPDVMLGGWLHRRTCHVAATVLRGERRRHNREKQAAQMNALHSPEPNLDRITPLLDEAINRLNATDRTAIVLRYFEDRDLRSIGAALGSNADAAQKRVSRALEKLRVLLSRRGLTASTALLASVLSTQAATVAPVGMATSISTAALATASASGGLTLALLKLTAMTKIKLAAGVAVAAALGTICVVENQTWTSLRREHEALQQELVKTTGESAQQSGPQRLGSSTTSAALNPGQLGELERLRREIGAVRQQTSQFGSLRAEHGKLRAASTAGESADPVTAELNRETKRRQQALKKWGLMFRVYANDHNGQFPNDWEQVAEQIPAPERASFFRFAKDNFEIVYRGNEEGTRGETMLFREKQARRSPDGKWIKVYGLADGSAQTFATPDGNFDIFEKKYITAPK